MKLSLSILGRTFTLALTNEPDEVDVEGSSDVVTGTPSSVEFGFAHSATWPPAEYWEDGR